jgi:ferredoxin-fold anticodon binding domain-containing protein
MENIKIRCRSCGKELEGISGKTVSCGCSNMATIRNGVISALDLDQVVMISSPQAKQKNNVLSNADIMWQEERRQRKVRRLDFEVR